MNVIDSQTLKCLIMERGKKKACQKLLTAVEMTKNSSLDSCTRYTSFNYDIFRMALVGLFSGDERSGVEVVQKYVI